MEKANKAIHMEVSNYMRVEGLNTPLHLNMSKIQRVILRSSFTSSVRHQIFETHKPSFLPNRITNLLGSSKGHHNC
jgi:hypothetical protein